MKFYYWVLALIFFSIKLYATTAESPVNQLAGLLAQYQSLTANFSQSVYDAKGNDASAQVSSGNMALKRPENLKWETQKPTEQLIMTDGKTLWIYDKDLQQVTISQLQKKSKRTPALLMMTSASDIEKNYQVSFYPSPKAETAFQLIPKSKQPDFQWVRFYFENKKLSKMQIQDNIGQLTSISFSQQKTNPSLPNSLFHLTIPKGVDIIKE